MELKEGEGMLWVGFEVEGMGGGMEWRDGNGGGGRVRMRKGENGDGEVVYGVKRWIGSGGDGKMKGVK